MTGLIKTSASIWRLIVHVGKIVLGAIDSAIFSEFLSSVEFP